MKQRLSFIDQTRGLLLVLMTLDHARAFIHRSHPTEIWGVALPNYQGSSVDLFFRVITHFCAPGFFFLMGASMALYAGTQAGNARAHFVKRGLVLIAVQLFVENVAWYFGHASATIPRENYGFGGGPGVPGPVWNYIGVLAALGGSMIVGALLLQARTAVIVIVAVLAQCVPAYVVTHTDPALPINTVIGILTLPGQSGVQQIRYSLFPWLSLAALGILYGRAIANNQGALKFEWMAALALGSTFVVLRLAGMGDYHVAVDDSWLSFFNMNKYPPSPVYQLFTMAGIFALLALFGAGAQSKLFRVYGQATLFFYVAHLYLLGAIGWIFRAGAQWITVVLCDVVVLAILYFACQRWTQLKRRVAPTHWIHLF